LNPERLAGKPTAVDTSYTEHQYPSGWFGFPGSHDAGDVTPYPLLVREGETVTLKRPSGEIVLTAWQAIELAELVAKPRRAAKFAALIGVSAERAAASGATI